MHRLLFVCLGLVACRDYPYRHEIRGTVISHGQPLAGAVVQRLNGDGEPYGFDDDYRRETDAEGRFAFVAEGTGPSPLAYAPWQVRVRHPEHPDRLLEVRATWSDDRATCFGYCARDFVIELP